MRILAGLKLVYRFWSNFGFGASGIIAAFSSLPFFGYFLVQRRRGGIEKIKSFLKPMLLVWIVLPGTLIAIRLFSAYPFEPRYFLPFTGAGFIYVLSACHFSLRLAEEKLQWLRIGGLVTLCLFALSTLSSLGQITIPNWGMLRKPTQYSSIFTQVLREETKPILLIGAPYYAEMIDESYLKYFLSKPNKAEKIVWKATPISLDFSRNNNPLFDPNLRGQFDRFFMENASNKAGLTVILHQIHRRCPRIQESKIQGVTRFEIEDNLYWLSESCVWVIKNVHSIKYVQKIAKAVGFPQCLWPSLGGSDCAR